MTTTTASDATTAVITGRRRRIRRRILLTASLGVLVLLVFTVTLMVGHTFYPLDDVIRVILGQQVPGASFTVGELRLPRASLGALVGFAFGVAGVTFQTMLRNPLASPDIIGISWGASAAAVVGIVLNLLHLLANLVFPYMPTTSESILEQLGFTPDSAGKYPVHIPDVWNSDAVKPGQKLGEPKLLFSAIPASKVEEWREEFGGEELKKQKAIEAEKAAAKKAAKEKEKEKKKLKKLAAAAAQAEVPAKESKEVEQAVETPLVIREKEEKS